MNGRFQRTRQLSFNVVTFDLFGTLVDIDDNSLPCLTIDGVSIPSLLAAPFGRLFELIPTMDLGDALVAYFQVGEELKSRPAPELDCELPSYTHLIRALERIGVLDQAVMRDVVQSQREVTLQAARPAEGDRRPRQINHPSHRTDPSHRTNPSHSTTASPHHRDLRVGMHDAPDLFYLAER